MLKYVIIFPVKFYQWAISPLLGRNCRYTPSCSTYMIKAVEQYGVAKGGMMGLKRFSKCHPMNDKHWHETQGHDPVPPKKGED